MHFIANEQTRLTFCIISFIAWYEARMIECMEYKMYTEIKWVQYHLRESIELQLKQKYVYEHELRAQPTTIYNAKDYQRAKKNKRESKKKEEMK